MAKFKKRVTRHIRKGVKVYRKHKILSGITGDVIVGGATGALVTYAAPMINSKIPKIGPFGPTTVAIGGAGAALKLMKKGGHSADILLGIGAFMAGHDLVVGTGMSAGASNGAGIPFG